MTVRDGRQAKPRGLQRESERAPEPGGINENNLDCLRG